MFFILIGSLCGGQVIVLSIKQRPTGPCKMTIMFCLSLFCWFRGSSHQKCVSARLCLTGLGVQYSPRRTSLSGVREVWRVFKTWYCFISTVLRRTSSLGCCACPWTQSWKSVTKVNIPVTVSNYQKVWLCVCMRVRMYVSVSVWVCV